MRAFPKRKNAPLILIQRRGGYINTSNPVCYKCHKFSDVNRKKFSKRLMQKLSRPLTRLLFLIYIICNNLLLPNREITSLTLIQRRDRCFEAKIIYLHKESYINVVRVDFYYKQMCLRVLYLLRKGFLVFP